MSLALKNESPKKRNSKLYKKQTTEQSSLSKTLSEKNQEINRLKLLLQQQNQSLQVYESVAKTLIESNNLQDIIHQKDKEETVLSHLLTANVMLEHTISSLHKRQVNTYYLPSIIDKLKLIEQQYLPKTIINQKNTKENQWQEYLVSNINQLNQKTKHTDFTITICNDLPTTDNCLEYTVSTVIYETIQQWIKNLQPSAINIDISNCNNNLLIQLQCFADLEKKTLPSIKKQLKSVKNLVESAEGNFLVETSKNKQIAVNILV